jgi:hypothetical protein
MTQATFPPSTFTLEHDVLMYILRRMHEGDTLTFCTFDKDGEEQEVLNVTRNSSDFYGQMGGQDIHAQAFDLCNWITLTHGLGLTLAGIENEADDNPKSTLIPLVTTGQLTGRINALQFDGKLALVRRTPEGKLLNITTITRGNVGWYVAFAAGLFFAEGPANVIVAALEATGDVFYAQP